MSVPLLQVSGLTTCIDRGDDLVTAVDGLSFTVNRGETFALVGESGCGKSMTALSILRLLPDAAYVAAGSVALDGTDLLALPEAAMRDVRGRRIAMIFQESTASLNPVMSVGEQLGEAVARHGGLRGDALERSVRELLDAVRIPAAARRVAAYPFELSGGMKQRVMIAIALAQEPELIVADEPTTALDVTIQAQILELLRELQRERGLGLLLITHDLAVVAETAQRIGVMYAGQLVENAERTAFFATPGHPYSRKLLAAAPSRARREASLQVIRGSVPPLIDAFSGCRFAERCDFGWDKCRRETPPLYAAGSGRSIRCHLFAPEVDAVRHPPQQSHADDVTGPTTTGTESDSVPLLDVRDLQVHFPVRKGLFKRVVAQVRAVDGVTFNVREGRTLGLVGESGCGKTTVGKGLLRLIEPTGGRVTIAGGGLDAPAAPRFAATAARGADRVPGSICVAGSAHARRRNSARRHAGAWHRHYCCGARRAMRSSVAGGRARCLHASPLPA